MTLAALAIIAFNRCEKEDDTYQKNAAEKLNSTEIIAPKNHEICGEIKFYDLLAGQHIVAGSIQIWNSSTDVYVSYETSEPWKLGAIHLYVGPLSGLPVNPKGNPVVGHFPIKKYFENYASTYSYSFPADSFPNGFIVAAHAEIFSTNREGVATKETAWGSGKRIVPQGNWGMYIDGIIQQCKIDELPQK